MRWLMRKTLDQRRLRAFAGSGDRRTDRVDVRALTAPTALAALLVRPDGYVAWAVDGEVGAGDLIDLRTALTRWFGEHRDRRTSAAPMPARGLS